jgi:hypothetical protein
VQILVEWKHDPVIQPGGQMHGIGEHQPLDPFFAGGKELRAVQDRIREVLNDTGMLRAWPLIGQLELPNLRRAERAGVACIEFALRFAEPPAGFSISTCMPLSKARMASEGWS